jgi:ribonuclease HI
MFSPSSITSSENSIKKMSSPTAHISNTPEYSQESLYPYPNRIHIQDRPTARAFAESISHQPIPTSTLTIWADGSASPIPNHPCAGAISYIHPLTHTRTESVAVNHLSSSTSSEILAIWEAFRHAATLTEYFDNLTVFSDAQNALCMLLVDNSSEAQGLVLDIIAWANRFYDEGIRVDLRWTPRDVHVEAQKRVDELSRAYRRMAASVVPAEVLEFDVAFLPISFAPQPEVEAIGFLGETLRDVWEDALARGAIGERKKASEGKELRVDFRRIERDKRATKIEMSVKRMEKEEKRRKRMARKAARLAKRNSMKKKQNSHLQAVFIYGKAVDNTNCHCLHTFNDKTSEDVSPLSDMGPHPEIPSRPDSESQLSKPT